ncbi:Two component system response regulator, GGDEF domain-containing [Desulfonema limicola]|uniref:diguanylate cyclase n=1 Tax=Desulfonema limicola TaxID=45656 RepID=A0A975B6Y0_9BACT|nr:diguanylate cyclase [Desulfonema limicola]QTA79928.1 Two component system response regulator, GGDEF domain-containing [Desulfonema limicola]
MADKLNTADISKQGVHILIVDDDVTVRFLMNEFMETVGYQAYMASNGEEALELLKTNPVDVVVTDIMMPGMDGLELTELIKLNYDIEVIVMTGYSGDYSYEEVINKGASDFVFKPVRFEELLLRLKRVLKERYLKEELRKLAITDDLTTLFNARHFYKQLKMEVDRSRRYKHILSLLLIDIDYFKSYNDTYGHLAGDKVLARIGQVIQSSLRRMDSAYRYGGEEFTIILPDTGGEEAIKAAKRISSAINSERFKPVPEKEIYITVSIGIAEYCAGEELEAFVKRADKAMYKSKEKGRNRITLFSEQGAD